MFAEEKHRERVAKNPDRIAYAIEQFKMHGIEYQLKNEQTGHFHCWRKSDDKLFQFSMATMIPLIHANKSGIPDFWNPPPQTFVYQPHRGAVMRSFGYPAG